MTTSPRATDRQQRQKATHRLAIATAAAELAREYGTAGFSAVQLADRADVSRRTVFNHFPSLDDAINAGLTAMIEEKVEEMASMIGPGVGGPGVGSPGAAGLSGAFDDISRALLSLNLLDPMRQIADTIAGRGADHPSTRLWVGGVMQSIMPLLLAGILLHAPESTPVERTQLAQSLLSAIEITFTFWYSDNPGEPDDTARESWRTLFSAGLERVRSGFGDPTASAAARTALTVHN